MGVHEILAQIDREISQLKQARAMLEGGPKTAPRKETSLRKGEDALPRP